MAETTRRVVREIIREHDRRRAARLREREAEMKRRSEETAAKYGGVAVWPTWPAELADILEADDG